MTPAYTYAAKVNNVHDGDTIDFDIDLGFSVWAIRQSFRLLGCNAAELGTPGGDAAAANLKAMLPPGTPVTLTSVKPDKYGGRYDAKITLADGTDLVQTLIAQNWAAAWSGTGTKPVPPWPRPATPAPKEH